MGEKLNNGRGKVTQLEVAGLSSDPSSLAPELTDSQLPGEAQPPVLATQI